MLEEWEQDKRTESSSSKELLQIALQWSSKGSGWGRGLREITQGTQYWRAKKTSQRFQMLGEAIEQRSQISIPEGKILQVK